MSKFGLFWPILLIHEGCEYKSDDNGRGPCKYGITLDTAKAYGETWDAGDIEGLTPFMARFFYQTYFWCNPNIGQIENQTIANHVADFGANAGVETSIATLQNAANKLSTGGLEVDGRLGPLTLLAVNSLPWAALLYNFMELAREHYEGLVYLNPKLSADLPGWIDRLNDPAMNA